MACLQNWDGKRSKNGYAFYKSNFFMKTIDTTDMQGLIVRGYKELKAAYFMLLHITDKKEVKSYLNYLLDKNEITPGDRQQINLPQKEGDNIRHAVQIAFTSKGLKVLGLADDILSTFSREFIEGMDETFRSQILGDLGDSSPKNWQWGGCNTDDVHLIMLFYAKTPPSLADLIIKHKNEFRGIKIIKELDTFDTPESKEHFGFHDGISQPPMGGLPVSSTSSKKYNIKDPIKPGEFVLGYLNEYNQYCKSPHIYSTDDADNLLPVSPENNHFKDLGKNGTYLIYRQIKQDVFNFWKYLKENSKEPVEKDSEDPQIETAIRLGAKMVGRWPGGAPLVKYPEYRDRDKKADIMIEYSKDRLGQKCPFGAHIRRANPRDQLFSGRGDDDSKQMIRKHQLLRRGRVFGKPLVASMHPEDMLSKEKDDGIERGLHFICLSADISRQFEFVQNVWINNPVFGDLYNEVDPVIGTRLNSENSYNNDLTCPANPTQRKYKNIPQFTKVLGGSYFFLPGIKALRFIINSGH